MDDCRKRPGDASYTLKTRGCFSELQTTLKSNRDVVGIATLTIVAFLVSHCLGELPLFRLACPILISF